MKIYINQFLALFLFHQGANAFTVQTPLAQKSTALRSDYLSDMAGSSVSTGGVAPAAGAGTLEAPPSSAAGPIASRYADISGAWDIASEHIVQGGSLRTWSFVSPAVERVQVLMKTDGRPLNANVDLWQGPDNTPQKMGIYIEDGSVRPFCAVIETPRGQNTIAIRNTAQMEFPLRANVEADVEGSAGLAEVTRTLADATLGETIQGGSLKTYSFAPSVSSVQVLLTTDGRPLNARIELLQGPNNNKQVVEVYTEDGLDRPFFIVLETPGVGNVVRCLNTAPLEFPMTARVEPYMVETGDNQQVVISDGGSGWGSRYL